MLRPCRGLVALVLCFVGMASFASVEAQDAPPEGATPLTLGTPVRGMLLSEGSESYAFELPAREDVLVMLEADAVVLDRICIGPASGDDPEVVCQAQGGGGGDGPVRIMHVIPARDPRSPAQTVWLTLQRPPLPGPARYTLTTEPMAAQRLVMLVPVTVAPRQDYQVYALDLAAGQTFFVQVEDTRPQPAFLWTAVEPYAYSWYPWDESALVYPRQMDVAEAAEDTRGLRELRLFVARGKAFVLVRADTPYTLRAMPLPREPLAEGERRLVSLSPRQPLLLYSVDAAPGDRVTIEARVLHGSGAAVRLYDETIPRMNSTVLGDASTTGAVFPLSGSFDATIETDRPQVLAVQVPPRTGLSPLTIEVVWRRSAGD